MTDALRALLPAGDCRTRKIVEARLDTLGIAGRRKGELHVALLEALIGFPETVDQGRRQGQCAAPRKRVVDDLAHQRHAAHTFVDGRHVPDAHDGADGVVVAEVLSDTRQVMHDRNAERLQVIATRAAKNLFALPGAIHPGPGGL